jgi:hypothetical protein
MSTQDFEQHPAQTTDDAGADAIDGQALLQELATSIAFLPQDGMADGETPPEGSIAIPVIEQDGTQYVPVFTSEEALRAAGADPAPAVGLPLAELAANWPSPELWLAVDPGSENGLTVPPEAVQALAAYAQGPAGA